MVCFIETCYSGNIDFVKLVLELSSRENGAAVFCSTSGKQSTLEKDAWGNGAFTKAVLEGLGGMADLYSDKKIKISEMQTYIEERIKEMTKGRQSPISLYVYHF